MTDPIVKVASSLDRVIYTNFPGVFRELKGLYAFRAIASYFTSKVPDETCNKHLSSTNQKANLELGRFPWRIIRFLFSARKNHAKLASDHPIQQKQTCHPYSWNSSLPQAHSKHIEPLFNGSFDPSFFCIKFLYQAPKLPSPDMIPQLESGRDILSTLLDRRPEKGPWSICYCSSDCLESPTLPRRSDRVNLDYLLTWACFLFSGLSMMDRSLEDATLQTSSQEIDTRLDPKCFCGEVGLRGFPVGMNENAASVLAP